MFLLIGIFDFFVLSFLSLLITRSLSRLIHRGTKRLHLTVAIFSFLFLPGTFLHELSHLLIATLLGVKTYDFVLTPILEEKTLRLGSVSIAKTDAFRKTLIGMAPFVLGLSLLFVCLWFVSNLIAPPLWVVVFAGYIVFEVSNTMFPSKADLQGSLPIFFLLLGTFVSIIFLVGNAATRIYTLGSTRIFQQGVLYLTIIIAIDICVLFLLRLLLRVR